MGVISASNIINPFTLVSLEVAESGILIEDFFWNHSVVHRQLQHFII